MLCLYCGTFNPIHNAHIRVAQNVLGKFGIDKVLFIPSKHPPHKSKCNIDSLDRLRMVELAVKSNSAFEVSDIEHRLCGKSYTYNTILELKKIYDCERFNFIIGTDAFRGIENWYKADELKEHLNFIVYMRASAVNVSEFEYLRRNGYKFNFTELEFCDISSTEVRYRVEHGKDIKGLVPENVEEYINEHGLYKQN